MVSCLRYVEIWGPEKSILELTCALWLKRGDDAGSSQKLSRACARRSLASSHQRTFGVFPVATTFEPSLC